MNKIHTQPYTTTSGLRGHISKSLSLWNKVPVWYQEIHDPGSRFVTKWNRNFLVIFLIALFVDPLYFYLPFINTPACMRTDIGLGVIITILRTISDAFFCFYMFLKFRTAFVSPTSRVFGRGELVMDQHAIAIRYLKSFFIIDLAAALPLPQIVIWGVVPAFKNPTASLANHTLALVVLFQYVPRLYVIFPLNRRINKTSGAVAQTAWAGAAYNLLLYILASHVLGAIWYVTSIQRQHECWKEYCVMEMNATHSPSCDLFFLDCDSVNQPERQAWLEITQVVSSCDALDDDDKDFQFGMFADAFTRQVASTNFIEKYFYCLWWGLKQLSSYGQNIKTSTFSGETLFCIGICSTGLVLFAHLIGQVQNYLQSTTARLEEWRIKRKDTEEWMKHRQLPLELQERVRRFVQYQWIVTQGVDEESILTSLPMDLRRQIQRHLCLALVRRVPFFAQMDDQLLDAICERLVSSLNTKDTFLIREGDPVNEMLFIIRGELESSTTDGGRTGFFNSITLRPGDFCGEELLTWALVPNPSVNLPSSTRTVKSLTEVEAFALRAEDLKFVASQFKRLHSKRLRHAFRYYSHQWRTWGACYIQASWRRYIKRKQARELAQQEELYYSNVYDEGYDDGDSGSGNIETSGSGSTSSSNLQQFGATFLASKFAANTRKGVTRKASRIDTDSTTLSIPKFFKPEEPDFSKLREDS